MRLAGRMDLFRSRLRRQVGTCSFPFARSLICRWRKGRGPASPLMEPPCLGLIPTTRRAGGSSRRTAVSPMGTINMSGLVARLNDSSLLYDTKNISYGLVKSGYLTYVENWRQLMLRGINVNPDLGSSWIDRGWPGIDQYGFTLENPRSPIVFLVGRGIVTGVKKTGNSTQYLFASSSENTKYYCFDLMGDDEVSGPGLKTRDPSGGVTFNSRQAPLNVVTAIVAPLPGAPDITSGGRPATAYVGGHNQRISYEDQNGAANIHSVVDVSLDNGFEYAAFLPWSRSCGCVDTTYSGYNSSNIYGVVEGAYGRAGGISFYFGAVGRTTQDQWYGREVGVNYYLLPVDPRPTALVVKTSGLPFPFN